MLDMGIIRQSNTGMYTLLPLGYRALEKLISIVDNEMFKIGAQKMLLPHLTNQKLWEKSGRLKAMGSELLTLKDRHDCGYILSPVNLLFFILFHNCIIFLYNAFICFQILI